MALASPLSAAKVLIFDLASEDPGVAGLRTVCSGVVTPDDKPGGGALEVASPAMPYRCWTGEAAATADGLECS